MIRIKLRGELILPLIFLICISCVAPIHNNINKIGDILYFQKQPDDIENIEDFIDGYVFNERDRGIIYKFEKGYPEKVLGNEIRDFYIDENLLLFFNNEFIFTNNKKCPSIALREKYDNIAYNKGYIALSSKKTIDFFSLKYCGQLSIRRMKKLSNFFLSYPFIIYYGGKNIIIEEIPSGKDYLSIKMRKEILKVAFMNKELLGIICKDGIILLLDIKKKRIVKTIDLKMHLVDAGISNNYIFFLNKKGKFKIYHIMADNKRFPISLKYSKDIEDVYKAIMAEHSPAIVVKNKLIRINNETTLFNNYDNIIFDLIDRDRLIYLKDGKLYLMYIDKPRFIKKVIFNNTERYACQVNDNIVFKDLDNKYKSININTSELKDFEKYSANCNSKIILRDGCYFINNKLLKFADVVKKGKNYKLLMRVIDNIYYFYVE